MAITEILASAQIGFPLLSCLIVLPLAGAALIALLGRSAVAQPIAIAVGIAQLLLAVLLMTSFRSDTAALQFVERIGFYHLGVDGLSVLFVPLTALLGLLALVAARPQGSPESAGGYLAALLAFQACMMGAFVAANSLLFVVFFAAEVIPSWYLIARYGSGRERLSAANQYLFVMLLASAAVAGGLALAGGGSFAALAAQPLDAGAQTLPFLLMLLGLGIKAPLFPLHAWMPRVLEQGPMVGMSIFLVGVKLGGYGMLRLLLPVTPDAATEWLPLASGLAVCSIVYGALLAFVQTDLRRMLAFASISHIGVIMLGLFALNTAGMQGALLQMASLGLTGAGLFLLAGFIEARVGNHVSAAGGLGQSAPWLATAFLIIGLAGVGMPGTSGFNGEHLVMMGALEVHWLMALAVGLGTVLGAAYFLRYYQRAFMRDLPEDAPPGSAVTDLNARERLITLAVGAVVIWIGVYTTPFLRAVTPSVRAVEVRLTQAAAPAVAQSSNRVNQQLRSGAMAQSSVTAPTR